MCLYYLLFGVFSTVALAFNLLLLVAVLSMLQATLTLPGIAAIALALGMAIDANVLINERVREELRNGASPQTAIATGYERAWGTILDSNITTLIAGLALLAFGSGPVRGFAVVHCLGILTSMFSAVVFSRGLVNLWYGRQKKLKGVSIGQVWRPDGAANPAAKPERRSDDMEFFSIRRDIPFMRHALVLNVISFLTFARCGVLPGHARAAPVDRVHRRHGDGGRVRAAGRPRQDPRRGRAAWASARCRCRTSAPRTTC